jgi:hypothetical protein
MTRIHPGHFSPGLTNLCLGLQLCQFRFRHLMRDHRGVSAFAPAGADAPAAEPAHMLTTDHSPSSMSSLDHQLRPGSEPDIPVILPGLPNAWWGPAASEAPPRNPQ